MAREDAALETKGKTLKTDGSTVKGTVTMETTLIPITSGDNDVGDNKSAAQDNVGSDDVDNGLDYVNAISSGLNSELDDVNAGSDDVTVSPEKHENKTVNTAVTISPTVFADESSATQEFLHTFRSYLLKSTLALDGAGIVLNSLSMAVLFQMRSSVSNTYLLILTVCDTIFVVLNVPYNAMQLVLTTKHSMPWLYAYYSLYFEVPMHVTARNLAAFACAFMATDRFLKIAFPLKYTNQNWLHRPVPLTLVTGVLIYGYVVLDLAVRLKVDETYDQTTNSTMISHSPTILYLENFDLISTVFLVINCFVRYMPTLVLIVANISLLVSLRLNSRGITSSTDNTRTNNARSIRSAKLVLIFSFIFFLLSLPFTVFTILMMLYQDMAAVLGPTAAAIWGLSRPSLDALNSSINFLVLSAANPVFRRGLKVLIIERGVDFISGVGQSTASY